MKGPLLLALFVVGLAVGLAGCKSNDGRLLVTAVEPREGDAAGGSYVAIKGQNFKNITRNAKVYFGDRQGNVTRISDDEIIVQAPGGRPGEVVDILVVFEPGGELPPLKNAFKFVEHQEAGVEDLGAKKK